MADALVLFGIQKLWDLLNHEYEKFKGFNDQVSELQTDLNTLKSFLKDAEAKKHESATVRNFLDVIKEIVFDAEDIIETFILKDKSEKKGDRKKLIRTFAFIIPERRKFASEIGSLHKSILKVIRDMQSFGIQQIIADIRDPEPLQERVEFSKKYESNLVGLESNVKKLVGYLVEEDNVQVICMTGMCGLGKTTLARQAFNHDMVKKKFDRLVWVSVTQDCNLVNVWQSILLSLSPKEDENKILKMRDATILQDELFGLLATIKSLIVFDDIWKEEDWNLIKPIFSHKKGSKVLLTSRTERVAGCGETYINFKPECLSDQDSWTLFQRILMSSKDTSKWTDVDKEMEELGRQMIKHCKGLPLAIRVLGGLLAAKYTVYDWKRLSENIGSYLVGRTNDDNNNSFNRVLSLSYEELPSYLKHCFLYLAHFPEDYEINVEHLSYYWAAEGILRYNNGESIREVGHNYIEELVKRNIVISERENTTLRFGTCVLHKLMRDLCLSKAKEENFLHFIDIPSPTEHSQSLSTSRRFVLQYPNILNVERQISNPKVRSLVVVGNYRDWDLSSINFTMLRFLRVLHLHSAIFEGGRLPDSIGKLIHLRYLNLEYAKVSYLPSSLRNLKLLIYLNLDVHVELIYVPNVLMGMKELRYLALPCFMDKKTKLELNNLVNLETLINFSTENNSLEDLGGMARLRTLAIRLTGESSLENLSASIGRLRHLENLDIAYSGAKGTKNWRTLLEFKNLNQLTLTINIPLLSDELQFPSRLTSLTLVRCSLKKDPMPILEKFGRLKEVKLCCQSYSGRRMVCSKGGFRQLQKLVLFELTELEEWIIEEGSMPLLHTLCIWKCNKLKELPDGLRLITSLKDLNFNYMGKSWKKRLSKVGDDYYKVQNISSICF